MSNLQPVGPGDGPVAVTGSGGYIGSHIVLNLIQQGDWSVSDSDRPVIILGLVRGSLEPAPGVN
jgi:nucleoside-diphosphate-sugar epimerase